MKNNINNFKEDNEFFIASLGQERIWLANEFNDDSSYNIYTGIRIKGYLDEDIIEKSIDELIQNHDSLRSNFVKVNEKLIRKVKKKVYVNDILHSYYLESMNNNYLQTYISQKLETKLNLKKDPLFQVSVFNLSSQEKILVFTVHHIIADGWSTGVLLKEFSKTLEKLLHGKKDDNNHNISTYNEFVDFENKYSKSTNYQKSNVYWEKRIGRNDGYSELPKKQSNNSKKSGYTDFHINKNQLVNIKKVCNENNVTLFSYLLSAYKITLHKYSGQSNHLIGIPVVNRNKKSFENIIGYFGNLVPFEYTIDNSKSFKKISKEIQELLLEDLEHQNFPFSKIANFNKNLKNSLNTVFTLQNDPNKMEEIKGLQIEKYNIFNSKPKYDLSLVAYENKNGFIIEMEYDSGRYSCGFMQSFMETLKIIICGTENIENDIKDLQMIEKEKIKKIPNQNIIFEDISKDKNIYTTLVDNWKNYFNKTAIVDDDSELSFLSLKNKVDYLASYLIKQNIGINQNVGILMNKSNTVIIAILALLKIGARYVPIDPSYPKERKDVIINDANIEVCLTNYDVENIKCINLANLESLIKNEKDNLREPLIAPTLDNVAYIMYTSGTTGNPKGVQITHKNIISFAKNPNYLNFNSDDKMMLFSTLAFDASTLEIYLSLFNGVTLEIFKDNLPTLDDLTEFIYNKKITIIFLTSGLYQKLEKKQIEKLKKVRFLLTGGDKISYNISKEIKEIIPNINLLNGYGPTENTVFTTIHNFDLNNNYPNGVPIGTAVNNSTLYVLNQDLNMVPNNVEGELYVGGDGVSKGYINNLKKTQLSFIRNPYDSSDVLYKTGDIVTRNATGELFFVGRQDNQVKIRGFRIELEEIENLIMKNNKVKDTVVTVKNDNSYDSKQLIAYYIGEISSEDLRTYLKNCAPNFMIPAHIKNLKSFPLTTNGKVDVNKLKELKLVDQHKSEPKKANNHVLFKKLWAKYLGCEWKEISDDQDFFELGGDSIIAIQIVSKLNKLGYILKPIDILRERTINNLTMYLKTNNINKNTSTENELISIWKDFFTLEPDKINRETDFFELGGDSIIAIQIVSRLNKLGYSIKPIDILNERTIENISKIIKNKPSKLNKKISDSNIYNTPIQEWFFNQKLDNTNHFNMAQSFLLPKGIEYDKLIDTILKIFNSISSIKVRYNESKNSSIPFLSTEEVSKDSIGITDFSGLHETERLNKAYKISEKLNKRINIKNGPILQGHIFDNLYTNNSVLYLTIHHLYIDSVSWRIFLNALNSILFESEEGAESTIQMLQNCTDYIEWGRVLNQYSKKESMEDNLELWNSDQKFPNPWPKSKVDSKYKIYKDNVNSFLNHTKNYDLKTHEILISSLYSTINKLTSIQNIVVDIESHGREYIAEGLDLSNSIGWFTNIYPLPIENVNTNKGYMDLLKQIKEKLLTIPYNGIVYGINKFIGNGSVKDFPKYISFNYMGKYNSSNKKNKNTIKFDTFISGYERSDLNVREHIIDLNCSILNNELILNWSYDSTVISDEFIQNIANLYKIELKNIERFIRNEDIITPSDFGITKSTQQSIDKLLQENENIQSLIEPTGMQVGMLYHTLLDPNHSMYIVQSVMDINNDLNIAKFEESWNILVSKNELLKSSFVLDNDRKTLLKTEKNPRLIFNYIDNSKLQDDEFERQFNKYVSKNRKDGINVFYAPMMNVSLIKKNDNSYRLLWTYHHAILDGRSFNLFIKELMNIYYDRNTPLSMDKSFSEYVKSKNLNNNKKKNYEFWNEEMKSFNGSSHLNIEKTTNDMYEFVNKSQQIVINDKNLSSIDSFIKSKKISLNTLCLSTWLLLISRYSNSSNVITGMTTSGRNTHNQQELDEVKGPLINSIPFLFNIKEEKVQDYMNSVQQKIWKVQEFDDYSLEDIKNTLNIKTEDNLFEFLYVFENYPDIKSNEQPTFELNNRYSIEHTNYPLTITIKENNGLIVEISYNDNIYNDQDILTLLNAFKSVMFNLLKNNDLSSVKLIDNEQLTKINEQLKGKVYELSTNDNIVKRFNDVVKASPNSIAIKFRDKSITYQELGKYSDNIAGNLNSNKGCIGIHMSKSIELFITIFGILKSGNSYCIIDPKLPDKRKIDMINSAKINFLITEDENSENLNVSIFKYKKLVKKTKDIEPLVTANINHDDTFYINFTSGSTGRPKGVQVTHGNILYMYEAWYKKYDLSKFHNFLQMANISFDVFQGDWIRALISGKTLVICRNSELMDPKLLHQIITENKIDFGEFVPYVMRQLLLYLKKYNKRIDTFKTIIIASDKWKYEDYKHLQNYVSSDTQIINSYGLTETTIDSTYFILNDDITAGNIPIGKPFDNQSLQILDKSKNPLPINVIGELYIGGKNVSHGYINHSNDDFLNLDFNGKKLFFKTGDYAKLNREGIIELAGRNGNQVKIRGMRIELSEIENIILKYPEIDQCVVKTNEDSINTLLIAFIKSSKDIDTEKLYNFTEKYLPYYMLPNLIYQLEDFPINNNGKIDVHSLPDTKEIMDNIYKKKEDEVHSDTQKDLIKIWNKLLGIENINIDDNFYILGGNSFTFMKMMFYIRDTFKSNITLIELMKNPTIKKISAIIEERKNNY